MARIYTKVGDKGQTSLVGGQKVSKDDLRLEAYGTVDELNSAIGWVRAETARHAELAAVTEDLAQVQRWLFSVGSILASVPQDRQKLSIQSLSADQVSWFEKRIDSAIEILPALRNFILPGGCEASARMQLARAVARRAERAIVRLAPDLPEQTIPFVNRLSDYLFVMARLCNQRLGVEDIVWKKD